PAKDTAVKNQERWIGERNRACAVDADGMEYCLKRRYAARIGSLHALAAYPFISPQTLIDSGKLDKITWSYDISYPRFERAGVDFSVVNARFAGQAKKAAQEATPTTDAGPERKQSWTYEQDYKVYQPSANSITIAVDFYGYSGGAHGYGATDCT